MRDFKEPYYTRPECVCCKKSNEVLVKKIVAWVNEHRSAIELSDDAVMYRDHFDSESLLEFIEGETK